MLKYLFLVFPLVANSAVLPDAKLTPGATRQVDVKTLCTTSTKLVRNTSESLKSEIYKEYGITPRHASECTGPSHSCYEVDHRLALEDSGADVKENLWIQSYDGNFNAHLKDKLENLVHKKICSGELTIKDAQDIFFGDWTVSYIHYFGKN